MLFIMASETAFKMATVIGSLHHIVAAVALSYCLVCPVDRPGSRSQEAVGTSSGCGKWQQWQLFDSVVGGRHRNNTFFKFVLTANNVFFLAVCNEILLDIKPCYDIYFWYQNT